jgi:hypothetical protein
MIDPIIFDGFGERNTNIGIFSPLFQLQKKNRYQHLPLMSIGLSVLLFILENMLSNYQHGTTNEELNHFLEQLLKEKLKVNMSNQEIDTFRSVLVDEYLRNNGAPFTYEYFDMQDLKKKKLTFHLLEYDDYKLKELENKVIRLKLSDEGLEILFKSKEMYNDLKLSIQQLMFRSQYQKGYFTNAYRQINEMALHVKNEISKTRSLQHLIMRDALGASKHQELEKQLDRINEQFEREQTDFVSIKQMIKDTMNNYYRGKLSEKELDGFDLVLQINDQLLKVIRLHESLFTEKQLLQRVMHESIEMILMNSFRTSINFEREVVEEILMNKPSIESLVYLLRPIFPLDLPSILHPEILFQQHKIVLKAPEKPQEITDIDEKLVREQREKELERIQKQKKRKTMYLYHILKPLIRNESYRIENSLKLLKKESFQEYESMIADPYFYSLLIDLHQSDYTAFENIDEKYLKYLSPILRLLQSLIEMDQTFLSVGRFSIKPSTETLKLNEFAIPNFIIQRGDLYAVSGK